MEPLFPVAALGYRFFRINDTKLYPWRLLHVPPWDTAVQTAVCQQYRPGPALHKPPVFDCECGLYAYHRLDQLIIPDSCPDRLVRAIVVGSGHIEVHQTGFRAEQMQLLHLYGTDTEIKMTATRYQVGHGNNPQIPVSAKPIPQICIPSRAVRQNHSAGW